MGRWTYYSPIGIGIALVLIMNQAIRDHFTRAAPWVSWLVVAAAALAVGLLAQLLMFGVQGVSAQVLPAPFGRSIRGRAAVWSGYLILLAVVLALVCILISGEELVTTSWVLAIIAALAGAGALLTYIWSWPAAIPDFGADERPGRRAA